MTDKEPQSLQNKINHFRHLEDRSDELVINLEKSQRMLTQAMDLAHLVNWEYDIEQDVFTFDDRFYALYGTFAEREGGTKMSSKKYAQEFVHPDDIHFVAE